VGARLARVGRLLAAFQGPRHDCDDYNKCEHSGVCNQTFRLVVRRAPPPAGGVAGRGGSLLWCRGAGVARSAGFHCSGMSTRRRHLLPRRMNG
jgi:hypothetical protein